MRELKDALVRAFIEGGAELCGMQKVAPAEVAPGDIGLWKDANDEFALAMRLPTGWYIRDGGDFVQVRNLNVVAAFRM